MHPEQAARAVQAALDTASSVGLRVTEAALLNDSNALTLRLLPGDVVARVSPGTVEQAQRELDLARALAGTGLVTLPDPRVPARAHARGGFAVSLWTHHPTTADAITAADYAAALSGLHAGFRAVEVDLPRFTDRVEEARRLLADPTRTPELRDADRATLRGALEEATTTILASERPDQPLHGEPHPGNVLATSGGPRFLDFETCCRGPVEFDVAHAPPEVAGHYAGLDPTVLHACRVLVLAMITTWRWDRDDQLPDGRAVAATWLAELRELTEPHE